MTRSTSRRSFPILVACALASCSGSGGGAQPAARLLVTAGTAVVEPAGGEAPAIDLAAVGASRVEAHYRLTTPANTPLQFELVSWRTDANGIATLSVDHVRDGNDNVGNDPLSLARVGLLPLGNGLGSDGDRTWAQGDGFVRLTIQGQITQDQMLAVQSEGTGVTIVEIAIGAPSAINRQPGVEPELPNVVSRDTVYSSNSWRFGLPTVAVSGDRTSIVCYEGDRQDTNNTRRYELRLQHDVATGAVTGGGTVEASLDSGYWRDHEIVALYNVLGVVRSEADGVRVRLSFDRGATFGEDVQVLPGFTQARLVQAAMAADYSIAIAAWRARQGGGLEFVLVEGQAVAFDAFGSPTWFQFTPAQVLRTAPADSSPLTTGIAWSAGGDLAVGYACNWFERGPNGIGWTSTTEFRCAVRRYGGAIVDTEVDAQHVFGMDPTVAVLGQGNDLRVFYAYEVAAGLRLATSSNAGTSWEHGPAFGRTGDYLPSVFARQVGGQVRVDVLYLAYRDQGVELHRSYWADWPSSPRVDEALTKAHLEQVPYPGPVFGVPPFPYCTRVKQINFLGYDATLDGDQLVIAYDEVQLDGVYVCGIMLVPNAWTTSSGMALPPTFSTAAPPPLAPGMTLPMPAPDPAHSHQLKVLRIE